MTVEAGQIVSGKVTGITNFGAFVNLPENQSGLVHISEISEGYVKDIADYLSVGDEVDVKVLKITPDGKINLSIRQANPTEANVQAEPQARPKKTERANRPEQHRPVRTTPRENRRNQNTDDFDTMMSQFLKDSEDRLSSLRRNTESKRGGRGGRRG
ncbi:RNA-binding protein S1 [Suicoccus acidiformans]|uniref:RNA-binding protein S1 n=1 Tax=Suicoccus acidiformans TaxID=2036206 RepID=A0A347WN82_9LACT|nr:S1 domain-containing RNA-binding protein [Suicoccus acidiformans]AXY26539.1 RNA-binding protein S1 [Suicoccus acidiformans]